CTNNTKNADNSKNEEFLREASSSNRLEIAASESAARNANSEMVREFARMIANDHRAIGEELSALAGRKQWQVASDLLPKHQRDLEDLNALTGQDFDEGFARLMVQSHEDAVDLYADFSDETVTAEKDRKNVDVDLRSFAASKLESLRTHLEQAKALRDSVRNGRDSLRVQVDSLGNRIMPWPVVRHVYLLAQFWKTLRVAVMP